MAGSLKKRKKNLDGAWKGDPRPMVSSVKKATSKKRPSEMASGTYRAEYATTDRASCHDFKCKKLISAGELRIGMFSEGHDHMNAGYIWYHPACFTKQFTFATFKDVNPPATLSDLSGANSLDSADKAKVKRLLEALAARKDATAKTAARLPTFTLNLDGSFTKKGQLWFSWDDKNRALLFGGRGTFDAKDDLKAAGARWHPEQRLWFFNEGALSGGLAFLAMPDAEPHKGDCGFYAVSTLAGKRKKMGIDLAAAAVPPAEGGAATNAAGELKQDDLEDKGEAEPPRKRARKE